MNYEAKEGDAAALYDLGIQPGARCNAGERRTKGYMPCHQRLEIKRARYVTTLRLREEGDRRRWSL